MKAVLISIQPKWCELIASGKKTVEVIKTKPKLETPFKVYIYETKGKKQYYSQPLPIPYYEGKGKVIGEFVCNEIYRLAQAMSGIVVADQDWCVIDPDWFRDASCLTDEEISNYLKDNDGFAWHISDLIIYDKPKELSEFHLPCIPECDGLCEYGCLRPLKRPPQSWCYVEKVGEG